MSLTVKLKNGTLVIPQLVNIEQVHSLTDSVAGITYYKIDYNDAETVSGINTNLVDIRDSNDNIVLANGNYFHIYISGSYYVCEFRLRDDSFLDAPNSSTFGNTNFAVYLYHFTYNNKTYFGFTTGHMYDGRNYGLSGLSPRMFWNYRYNYDSDTGILTDTSTGSTYPAVLDENGNVIGYIDGDGNTQSIDYSTYVPDDTSASIISPWQDDTSQAGGGDGLPDPASDTVGEPDIDDLNANSQLMTSGMIALFNPSTTQLASLASYLWTPSFYDAITKLFQDPLEAIIGLSIFPTSPATSGTENIKVGLVDTGVSAGKVSQQYTMIDFGSVTIREFWGNALDYNPYTKISIYLPFIGIKELNTDEVMNSTLSIKYYIDYLTGSANCIIYVSNSTVKGVLYNFSCNVATQVPMSGSNMTQIITSVVNIVASVGSAVATGGGSAVASVTAGTAMNVINSKMHVERSGRLDCNIGALGIKYPYVIVNRPLQSLASGFNTFKGYPSNITAKLSTLTGYTEIDDTRINGINATETELQQINDLLKGGIIL